MNKMTKLEPPKPTAAEVVTEVLREFSGRRAYADVADLAVRSLAAAGWLVTADLAQALDQFRNAAESVATAPAYAAFDRWLAQHDAQVAYRALREAASDQNDTVPVLVIGSGIQTRAITDATLAFRAERVAAAAGVKL